MKTLSFEVFLEEPIVHSKVFEDKYREIELTPLPKKVLVLQKSTFCFIAYMSTYVRDLYIYNKFIGVTIALTHVLSCCHKLIY